MTEHLLDDFHVGPGGNGKRRRGVSQLVRVQAVLPNLGSSWVERRSAEDRRSKRAAGPVADRRDDDHYVDLLWFDRRECLLLVHVGTLFPGVRRGRAQGRRHLRSSRGWRRWCGTSCFAEGLPLVALGELAAAVVLARTASRQMLGFMNKMARFAEYAIADAGGLARCDIAGLNREQRRLLHNRDGHDVRPIELAIKRLRHRECSNSRQA